MALVDIKVPDIGDFDEVTVIELLVKPGDSVKVEQSLLTVESDKASMEIPSSHAGVVKSLTVKLGDKVKEGSLVLVLEIEGAAAASAPAVSSVPQSALSAVSISLSASPYVANYGAASGAAIDVTTSSSGPIEIRVPDIGDFKDVTIIEVLVKTGDSIRIEQSLITVESDKAAMEIPSSHAGVLKDLKVKVGDVVNVGDLLAVLEGAVVVSAVSAAAPAVAAPVAAVAAPASAPAAVVASPAVATAPAHNPTAPVSGLLPHASPSVRKFARELGVLVEEVKGSGPKGRITQDDVQSFTKAVMAGATQTKAQSQALAAAAPKSGSGGGGEALGLLPWPKVDFTKFGPVERKDMSRIKKISGANLHRNWVLIPHVTNHDDCDITELEAFRVQMNKENEKSGIKLTMLAFMIKATVAALKKFPEFNSSLDGDQLVMKQYFHVGFAADTPNGLVVPVIKDADKKGVMQISTEMGELAKKARDGKLGPADMSGACFTISSLGGIGGRYFTPIINAPEVAIMGVCKSQIEPKWDGKQFQPRLMLPLSLSWDHRVIDGASAARFNAYFGQVLTDFRRVLL
jgi:pyruvate dehydrogenase E2 component (dihydrolipoamide acetyltransferase)